MFNGASLSHLYPIPEMLTEHFQELKVIWVRKKKFHVVPV